MAATAHFDGLADRLLRLRLLGASGLPDGVRECLKVVITRLAGIGG